jgi:putative AlgH/UPF0301 family transcriptional regulator
MNESEAGFKSSTWLVMPFSTNDAMVSPSTGRWGKVAADMAKMRG